MGHVGDGRHARQDGGDDKGDHQGGPEIEVPVFHQVEGLGHYDHERGRYGGEPGRNDDRFPHSVFTREKDPVGDEQSHRIAADERGDRINGRVPRRAPQRPHHGLHQYAYQLQQTEAEQESKGHGTNGHDKTDRHGQLVKQEGQTIRRHQPGRPQIGNIHECQYQADQLEQAQKPVDGTGAPATIQQGCDGTIANQQQDQPHRQWALRYQKTGQVVHHDGAAACQFKGDEEDGDTKQAG